MDSFGNRLMLARAHAGHLSIREAADLCGLGRGAWTNWEKGARPVDIIEISEVVAVKLGVDRDWLLFGGRLGEAEPRTGRRIRAIGDDGQPNVRLSDLAVQPPTDRMISPSPATRPPANRPTGRTSGHTTIGVSPSAPQRRDPTRPSSPIPASKRRPTMVKPPSRPMAA